MSIQSTGSVSEKEDLVHSSESLADSTSRSSEQLPVRSCFECGHRLYGPKYMVCGVLGYPVEEERKDYDDDFSCGQAGRWWKPRRPDPPQPPGFWVRLGNVILKKLGECQDDRSEEPERPADHMNPIPSSDLKGE